MQNTIASGNFFEMRLLKENQTNLKYSLATSRNNSHHELLWVVKGQAGFSVDGKAYSSEENTLFCISPGQVRTIDCSRTEYGYYMALSDELLYLSANALDISFMWNCYIPNEGIQMINVNNESTGKIEYVLHSLLEESDAAPRQDKEMTIGLMRIFLIYLRRQCATSKYNSSHDLSTVRKFTNLVQKEYRKRKMVAEYAGELYVSANYLNTIVKKVTGHPASHHIQKQIILEAKRMAMYSDVSMKELAATLGFSDCAHFSKFFKLYAGINFSEYRSNCKFLV